jgi:NADH-quinone oxidoreductase subunit I
VADLAIRSYLPEIVQGLRVTGRHFFRNLLGRGETVTVQYPEERRPYAPRFRGLHRLMRREDGSVRCVACFCCSTACPSRCIEIVAGEHDDPAIEKMPVRFEIDQLLCIYCGMCEEACPCDAIRLDSGVHTAPALERAAFPTPKADLLSRGGLSVAKQGGELR